MNTSQHIIVTGAYGFIGSCMLSYLNKKGFDNITIVDDFTLDETKEKNLVGKKYGAKIERSLLMEWLQEKQPTIAAIIHLGAKTDTTLFDYSVHEQLNVQYTQALWRYCSDHAIPLIYASSAATYGDGHLGYDDAHDIVGSLQPLNPYGISKNEVDKWVLQQPQAPPFWAGLKFFNVYGPNEYHKERMASVIFHSFNQIENTGKVKLFKSHKEGFKDGEQLRDFVYVKDVVQVCFWMMEKALNSNAIENGLYNLGSGKARAFKDLTAATFIAQELTPNIEFIDMPLDIRDKYQYFTEANMAKLKLQGYPFPFYNLEEGVTDYVQNYLAAKKYY